MKLEHFSAGRQHLIFMHSAATVCLEIWLDFSKVYPKFTETTNHCNSYSTLLS